MKHLWLDLEDTLVEPILNGWFNVVLLPDGIKKVRQIIQEFQPDQVHIFSFAIWDSRERDKFNMALRERLEKLLNVTFSSVLSVDDEITPICCQVMGINPARVDFSDCSDFWSKQTAFRLNMQHLFKHSTNTVMLVDDAVIDETFILPKQNLTGHIVNILEYKLDESN